MNLKMYGVRDDATGEFVFFFQSENDLTMKRVVKGALLTKSANPFSTDIKDKKVFELGDIDTSTGIITPLKLPIVSANVSDLRLELIRDIKIAKSEIGIESGTDEVAPEDGYSNSVVNPVPLKGLEKGVNS